MGNFLNRIGNTVGLAPRSTIGTGIYAISDATRTAIAGILNPFEGIGKTAVNIKDAVHNAFTKGKRYQKLWRVPAALVSSPIMALEGAAETLRHTGCNLFRNVKDTVSHPFLNIGKSIKSVGSGEGVRDFKFSKIEEKSHVSPKMRLANLFK